MNTYIRIRIVIATKKRNNKIMDMKKNLDIHEKYKRDMKIVATVQLICVLILAAIVMVAIFTHPG